MLKRDRACWDNAVVVADVAQIGTGAEQGRLNKILFQRLVFFFSFTHFLGILSHSPRRRFVYLLQFLHHLYCAALNSSSLCERSRM